MIGRCARQIVPPIVVDVWRRVVRRLLAPERFAVEVELRRLRSLPPGQSATTGIFGRPFDILDGRSFAQLYELYFKRQLYLFSCETERPYIVDCGAHIGVTVTWWKTRYPNAKVVAFEADPDVFRILQKNCGHFKDVQLVNAAVWDKEGQQPFVAKGGEGGHMAEFSMANSHKVRAVPCVRLRSFLRERCDALKMDIEGAEGDVIRDCVDVLENVDRVFVEYHSFVGRPQLLGRTITSFEDSGFRLYVHTELPSPRPLHELTIFNGKDLRLDLFCYRKETGPTFVPWEQ